MGKYQKSVIRFRELDGSITRGVNTHDMCKQSVKNSVRKTKGPRQSVKIVSAHSGHKTRVSEKYQKSIKKVSKVSEKYQKSIKKVSGMIRCTIRVSEKCPRPAPQEIVLRKSVNDETSGQTQKRKSVKIVSAHPEHETRVSEKYQKNIKKISKVSKNIKKISK